jgi:hypothetical protein
VNEQVKKRAKEKKDSDDEVEELHVSKKKKKIEKESSSPPQKQKMEKHWIFYDLHSQEEKKKWSILGKMEGMTSERQTNWGKGWYDTNNIPSTFYNKEEGYNKEWFEEDNNRINIVFNKINNSSISSSSSSSISSTSSLLVLILVLLLVFY